MKSIPVFFILFLLLGCQPASEQVQSPDPMGAPSPMITEVPYGETTNGIPVSLYTLRNQAGMEVDITNYGGIITSIRVPDRAGTMGDVVLGFDSLQGYLDGHPFFGCIVGRYGNRIANGLFTLDGTSYELAKNNGPNHLHGGIEGFDKRVWTASSSDTAEGPQLVLTYTSPDGEEGYPGTLDAKVTYLLGADNNLVMTYEATTDAPTIVNLTNHTYFNLRDGGESLILDHELTLHADAYTPVDETLIPTGEITPVAGTPFDFSTPRAIGERIDSDHEQIQFGGGYDHNYVVNEAPNGLRQVAEVYEPSTGRVLLVSSTEPGVQFYSGNFLNGEVIGKEGSAYQKRSGFCLETQHYPDSPNQPQFPSTVLRPGETYETTTVFSFTTR